MGEEGIKERLDFLEFRQELLFNNSDLDRLLFEYKITRDEYTYIMDLMDRYRKKIGKKQPVSHIEFEEEMYGTVPKLRSNYHFCEYITRAFMDDHRWEEVFASLYGELPKYKHLMKER